jgi:outer membrane protein OmpA-like peptidoglycan-associated protein
MMPKLWIAHSSIVAASIAAAILLGSLAKSPLALAQSNPDTNQIIQSLTPLAPSTMVARGIRPIGGPTPSGVGASAGAQTPNGSTASQALPSVNLTVEFQTGSADLTPQAQETLDQLGKALTSAALSTYRFRIEGHTDTVGEPEANMSLSERRAAAVARYLETKFAVGPQRLETVGKGDRELLVSTPPQTPEPRNRRVQVINLGA